MSIIRTFGELAQEFLEQEVEAFEYMLATEGYELVDEHEWHDNWESFGSYDPLINLTLYLFGSKDVCIDCLKEEGYSIIHEKLDAFLIRKGDPTYIGIDKSSDIYKVLARRFLVAEIDAFGIMEELCTGGQFDYKYKDGVSKLELGALDISNIQKGIQEWKTSPTRNYQILVNKKAKEIMQQDPTITKRRLSEDVFSKLPREKPVAATIFKDYLVSYPNFK